jgi:histidinol-phosphate aminotransferase
MAITRRTFVRTLGAGGAGAISALLVAARGREALAGAGLDADALLAWSQEPGARGRRVIRISSNENPVGPPRSALDALRAALDDVPRYPFATVQTLTDALARHHGVGADHLLLGCGSTEILRVAVLAFTSPSRPLVTAAPTFEDPGRTAEALGVPVIAVPVDGQLRLDLEAMADRARGAGLVFLCNPNNPTAALHSGSAVADFIARVHRASPETTVLVDEAYHHYVEDPGYRSAVSIALERPRVVVSRTFSKLYGMAGLRLGYAVARPETLEAMRRHRLGLNVNTLVAAAATAALADEEAVAAERARNREAREFTRRALADLGYPCGPSEANFIMVDVRRDAREFQKACLAEGVQIGRPFPPLTTYARISIGTIEEMRAAVEVFRKVLATKATA